MDYALNSEKVFARALFHIKNLLIPCEDNEYSPKFLGSRILFYLVIFLLAARIIVAGFFIPFPKNIFFADITKIDLLNSINQSREKAGLYALQENTALDQAATLKARDMIQKGYFSHQSPQGVSPWFWFGQVGYHYTYAGENLAIGFINSRDVFDAWFNSPSHRDNLLNPNYKEVGTAILSGFGDNNAVVVVQLFGSLPAKKVVALAPLLPQPVAAKIVINGTKTATKNNNVSKEEPIKDVPLNPVEKNILGSQDTISQSVVSNENANDTPYIRFLNFIVYDYEQLIKYILYGFLIVISISLLLNILINFSIQNSQLIFKSLLLIAMLFLAVFLNKDALIHILPFNITV